MTHNVDSIAYILIHNGKLANQIARLQAIYGKMITSAGMILRSSLQPLISVDQDRMQLDLFCLKLDSVV